MSAQDHPEAKFFRCHFAGCKRIFKRRDRLDVHQRVHTGERPFVCKVNGCGKSYARSQHLSRHVENAHNLPDESVTFSCSVCKRQLANIYSLQKHMKAEHEEKEGPKQYKCPEEGCIESFHKKKQLVSHRLQKHTAHILEAKKCHRCPYEGCDKTFVWMNLLKRHIKIHQGYPCSTEGCDKVLPTWSALRKHVAQDHVKVHSCDECGIKFSNKSNLTQHMKRKHQGSQKTFVCPVEDCKCQYKYKSNLALHIRDVHEGESIWKNRQRRKPVKKTVKKISHAAKLCGLDDRGEVLKLRKPRGKTTTHTDNKISSEVECETDSLDVVESKQLCVTSPCLDATEEIVKEQNQNQLHTVAIDDPLSLNEKQQNEFEPSFITESNPQPSEEVAYDFEIIDPLDASFKGTISLDKSRMEITVIVN